MRPDRIAKHNMESKTRSDDGKILVIPSSIAEGGLNKADRIKGVTLSLVVNALAVMDDMWEDCRNSPELAENYYLLRHYLSYIKRFCEGKV
jgi:hypothetical protein